MLSCERDTRKWAANIHERLGLRQRDAVQCGDIWHCPVRCAARRSDAAQWIAAQCGAAEVPHTPRSNPNETRYRLEELLVHEERLTTSGVGTGEQWYLLVTLPAL